MDDEPIATLTEVRRLRDRSRTRAHGGAWLPATVLAGLVLLSGVLYRSPLSVADTSGPYPYWPGLPSEPRSSAAAYAFWLVGLPGAFALTALWYRHRTGRLGIRVAWPALVIVGLGGLFLLLALVAVPPEPVVDPYRATGRLPPIWHGFASPLLAVALSLLALAWVERAVGLAVAGLWLGLLVFMACAEGFLGLIPGWLAWLLGGGEGPALGGQITTGAVPALVFLLLPLLLWLGGQAVRARRAR